MDEVSFDPMKLTDERRFPLALGAVETLPEFRIRIEARSSKDVWSLIAVLSPPREVRESPREADQS